MSAPETERDWDPGAYARFRGLRLRPALDLLAQLPEALPPGDVVDLGCGAGAVAEALTARWPGRRLSGVDASPAMLAKAAQTGRYACLEEADAARWQPARPPALIFSNALCHWLPDHRALFARLAGMLAPGGVLAVQMPRQYAAPSHALLRRIAARNFPDRFDFSNWRAPVSRPGTYARMLSRLGAVSVWETRYLQRLEPVREGHPVRHFTQATAMRPFLSRLGTGERETFTAAYDRALGRAYRPEADGTVWFGFLRLFFVLCVPSGSSGPGRLSGEDRREAEM